MKCPHCLVTFHDEYDTLYLDMDKDGHWAIVRTKCANCRRFVFHLLNGEALPMIEGQFKGFKKVHKTTLVHPKGAIRQPVPAEVPAEIAEDYVQASLVLTDSPKASAALSRRCLQHLLRTVGRVKKGDLVNEIQQVLDDHTLPSHLAESIDAIRNIGNFSAHPQKSTATGEILPVEPHEAEWNLDVLEGLFDFYYVQPALTAKKRAALNAKLGAAGKPPMK